MVKKKNANKPTISELPIPASVNPMVIDLPDGQKIFLNKIDPGSIIEVATWRGTGRPDSRTNRIMLGVSDPTAAQSGTTEAKIGQPKSERKFRLPFSNGSGKKAAKEIVNARAVTGFLSRVVTTISKALKRTRELTPVETTTDLEINAWLENLSREFIKEPQSTKRSRPITEKKALAKKSAPKKNTPKKSGAKRSAAK